MVKTAEPADIMEVSELKQLLHLSKRQQINCAIGMTRDKQGVILLHRRTKPRKLLAELLRKQSPQLQLDRATLRFGHANVAGGSDSTTVHFTVNKASPDTLRVKMLEKLRAAGYQHCDINVDAGIEDEPEDEDDGKATGPEPTARAPTPDTPPSATPSPAEPTAANAAPPPGSASPEPEPPARGGPSSSAQPQPGAQPDPAALKATLRDLAEKIRPTIAADPNRGATLLHIAKAARDDLAKNDPQAAATEIETLRHALGTSQDPLATNAAFTPGDRSGNGPPNAPSSAPGTAPGNAPAAAPPTNQAPSPASTPNDEPGAGPAPDPQPGSPPGSPPASPPGSPTASPTASPMPPASQTAPALAKLLDIDPATFKGHEDKAVKVMARLQQFRSLPEQDQLNFPGYIASQGFPPGDKFFQLCQERALDARNGNPAWAKGVNPEPPDAGRMDRLKAAIVWAGKDLGGDIGSQLLALAEPENLAIMGGFVVLFLAAQASPIGWVADLAAGALLLGTALAVGIDVVGLLKKLDKFIDEVNKRDGKPEVAGKALSEVVANITVGVLMAIILHSAGAKAKGRMKFKPPGATEVDVVASKGGLVRLPKDQVVGLQVGGDLDALGKKAGSANPGEGKPGDPADGQGRPPPDPPPRPIQEVADDLAKAKSGSPERQKLVDEFARAATHAKPPANRVVLGKWEKPGEGGYIDQAKSAGGRWYEVDENAFKTIGGETAWDTNVAFLRQQLESGVPKVEFTNLKIDKALADFATDSKLDPGMRKPARIKEIEWLLDNAKKFGYVRNGNTFVK